MCVYILSHFHNCLCDFSVKQLAVQSVQEIQICTTALVVSKFVQLHWWSCIHFFISMDFSILDLPKRIYCF